MIYLTNYEYLLGVSEVTFSEWFKEFTNQTQVVPTKEEFFSTNIHSLAEKICSIQNAPERVKEIEDWFNQEYQPTEIDYVSRIIDMFFINRVIAERNNEKDC